MICSELETTKKKKKSLEQMMTWDRRVIEKLIICSFQNVLKMIFQRNFLWNIWSQRNHWTEMRPMVGH